jgi:thioredoxin reductase (NADPH)
MVNRARQNPKVEFVLNSIPTEILGQENKVSGLKVQNVRTDMVSELKLDGVFLAIGYIPETEIFAKYIDINPMGYARPANRTMSKVPGVFIAGDVEDDHYRQAITAAADGCKAALDAEHWLSEQV